jgi:hypothetical protein
MAFVLCVGLVVLLAGCGPKKLTQSPTFPVKGKILLDGQPASFVLVRFTPVDNKGVEAVGRTDEEGAFELRTFAKEGFDGAAAGEYTVTVETWDPVRLGPIPGGGKATALPKTTMEAKEKAEVREEDNELVIQL